MPCFCGGAEAVNHPVICLMGPTAAGKTALALHCARLLPVEIVSVDSVMVYRGMNIGAAKPEPAILAEVPHHLVNCRDPDQPWSAAAFCREAAAAIGCILDAGKIPLLVGGSMLYFHALQRGLADMPPASPGERQAILAEAVSRGWPALHAELAQADPVTAQRIHPHDGHRIQRALEIVRLAGRPPSDWHARTRPLTEFAWHTVVIAPAQRSVLHERISLRFDKMLTDGLVAEVQNLIEKGYSPDLPALRAAGYRQAAAFLAGDLDIAGLREKGIVATRQLAKRQLTWLRHWPGAEWFDSEDRDLPDRMASLMAAKCV